MIQPPRRPIHLQLPARATFQSIIIIYFRDFVKEGLELSLAAYGGTNETHEAFTNGVDYVQVDLNSDGTAARLLIQKNRKVITVINSIESINTKKAQSFFQMYCRAAKLRTICPSYDPFHPRNI